MNYIKVTLLIIFFAISLLFFSCEKGTEPDELKPGRRDYTWTADTLYSPMWHGSSMWGSSANNVWVVGGNGSATNRVWHYDGEKWEHNTTPIYAGNCVFGFGENDVWIGGSEGRIWHYDGTSWSEEFTYKKNGDFYRFYVQDIWGVDRDNLMAVGLDYSNERERGFILKYNGSEWKEVYSADYNSYFYKIRSQNKSKSTYYIWSFKRSTPLGNDTTAIFKYKNNETTEIYEKLEAELQNGASSMTLINDKIYFSAGQHHYNIINDKLAKFITVDNINIMSIYGGRNPKDIILNTIESFVHYNGSDIQYLFYINNNQISPAFGSVVTGNTVFLMAGPFPTIVYKGVLNNSGG